MSTHVAMAVTPALTSSALIDVSGTGGLIRLVVAVGLCALLAAALRRWTGLGNGRDELTATARASAQLAVVGAIIAVVLGSWWLTGLFAVVMIGVASWTSAGRMGTMGRLRWWVLVPVASGAIPVTALLMAIGLLPLQPISLIPTAGILIGNAMTATSLAGRRSLDALVERRGELEAGLSLGLTDRQAALLVCQDAAKLALVPGLDQTRTVGLVTLPGAFVGTLLGGASPAEAAALQLLVLVGILLAQSISTALALEMVVRGILRRALTHP